MLDQLLVIIVSRESFGALSGCLRALAQFRGRILLKLFRWPSSSTTFGGLSLLGDKYSFLFLIFLARLNLLFWAHSRMQQLIELLISHVVFVEVDMLLRIQLPAQCTYDIAPLLLGHIIILKMNQLKFSVSWFHEPWVSSPLLLNSSVDGRHVNLWCLRWLEFFIIFRFW